MMRVDAFRTGDHFTVNFDMPGVDPASVEVTVEKNVLSVAAERHWTPEEGDQVVIAERPQGRFERKLYLSDNLNTDAIEAHYDRGVLSLHIPVSEASKPRKVRSPRAAAMRRSPPPPRKTDRPVTGSSRTDQPLTGVAQRRTWQTLEAPLFGARLRCRSGPGTSGGRLVPPRWRADCHEAGRGPSMLVGRPGAVGCPARPAHQPANRHLPRGQSTCAPTPPSPPTSSVSGTRSTPTAPSSGGWRPRWPGSCAASTSRSSPPTDTGDHVIVVNAAKIQMTAGKAERRSTTATPAIPGGLSARTYSDLLAKQPEETFRRAVKGMLPKGPLGRHMIRKLKVYAGPTHPHSAQRPSPLPVDPRTHRAS